MALEPSKLLFIFICHEYVFPVWFKFYISWGRFVCYRKVELNGIPKLLKIVLEDEIQAVCHIEVHVLELFNLGIIFDAHPAEKGVEDWLI